MGRQTPAGRSPDDARARLASRRPSSARASPVAPSPAPLTCAITWRSGLRGASFRAVIFEPGTRRGREIGRSVKLDWPPILPPEAQSEFVEAASGLVRSLVEAGWRPADRGPDWYAQRFVWTGAEAPGALGVAQPAAATARVAG